MAEERTSVLMVGGALTGLSSAVFLARLPWSRSRRTRPSRVQAASRCDTTGRNRCGSDRQLAGLGDAEPVVPLPR
jgi:hypothetical protein